MSTTRLTQRFSVLDNIYVPVKLKLQHPPGEGNLNVALEGRGIWGKAAVSFFGFCRV